MSYDLTGDIYTKKKDGGWECREHDMSFNFLKCLVDGRGNLDWESYAPARLSDADEKELESLARTFDYDGYSYIGSMTKESFAGLDVKTRIAEHDGRTVYVVEKADAKNVLPACVVSDDILRMSPDERKELDDFYFIEKEERGYGDGRFLDTDSFASQRDKLQRELRELYLKKDRYERLKESVEYLKLSSEEKENVDSSYPYGYLDEEIEETECKVDSLVSVIGILDWYSQYPSESAVLFLFGS